MTSPGPASRTEGIRPSHDPLSGFPAARRPGHAVRAGLGHEAPALMRLVAEGGVELDAPSRAAHVTVLNLLEPPPGEYGAVALTRAEPCLSACRCGRLDGAAWLPLH